jgi:hypothetical protein
MYHYEHVLKALVRFIDEEILTKMDGLQRWVLGTGAGIAANKGAKIFHSLKDHSLLKALDLVEDDDINVDLIYEELIKQASTSPITIDIPMVGLIKLNRSDVEKLYQMIIGG